VSRLHARIEWSEEIEKFVLVVIGRNGAWVDGIWSPSGSKVALGERCVVWFSVFDSFHMLPP
jgi:forkhead box protein K